LYHTLVQVIRSGQAYTVLY